MTALPEQKEAGDPEGIRTPARIRGIRTSSIDESVEDAQGMRTRLRSPHERIPEQRIRECGCAGLGYIRCAHFDDELIAFYQLVVDGHRRDYWHVCMQTNDASCGPWMADHDEALAAFHEAEARLLRGDV